MCHPLFRNIFRLRLPRLPESLVLDRRIPRSGRRAGCTLVFLGNSPLAALGVATLFALVLAVVLLVMGEIDFTQTLLMVVVGIFSDIVRQSIGTTYKRSILLAYPILPLGILVWLMKLWTASEWYYQGAAEEIGADYAEGLKTLSSLWALILVIILVLAAGSLGISLASRMGKK